MPDKPIRDRRSEKSREELLAEIAGLPSSAFIPTAHAAAYLGSTPEVLLNWRSQRRGPRYHGRANFIRYRISDLDLWMSGRAGEVRLDELPSVASGPTSCEQTARDAGILVSLCLQHGCKVETIAHALSRNADGRASGVIGAVLDKIISAEGSP